MILLFQLLGLLICSICAVRQDSNTTTNEWNREDRRDLQEAVGVVDDFILINAATEKAIMSIQNGATVNIATLNTFRFNIQAIVSGNVQSVKFGYNEQSRFHVANGPIFAFCGYSGTNFYRCEVLDLGEHTITVTPYSEKGLSGEVGAPVKITFTIINESDPDTPTKSPTKLSMNCIIPKVRRRSRIITINLRYTDKNKPFMYSRSYTKVDPDWDRIPPEYPIDAAEVQAAMLGTSLFISGGFSNGFASVTTLSFARDVNMRNSTWQEMDNMPVAIGITHAAVVVIGMKLYMCGGYSGIRPGPHVPNCFIYDHSKAPGEGQWSAFPNLPNGGSGGAGMIYDSKKRKLYYSGGGQRRTPDSIATTDVTDTWKISIDTPSSGWVRSTPFPYRANHLSSVTTNVPAGQQRHFFMGGQIGENELNGNVGDMYEFIPSTERWIRRASLPSSRSHTTVSTHAIGCGFIMAGGTLNSLTTKKNRTSEIIYYDVPTNRWTNIGDLPSPGATPPVFIDDEFIYFVSNRKTSRSKILI
jgi:hypothetical protein